MSTLEELTIVIGADTRRLARDMRHAENAVSRGFLGMQNNATRAGRSSGDGYTKALSTSAQSGMRRAEQQVSRGMNQWSTAASRAGAAGGQGFSSAFGQSASRGVQSQVQNTARAASSASSRSFAAAGVAGGRSFEQGLSGGLDSASRSAGRAGSESGGRFKSGLAGGLAGGGMLFNPIVAAAGGAATMIAGAMINAASNFEHSMQAVKAVTNSTGDEFDQLRDTAKQLGATTMYSASEAANAMEMLGMAGWSTDQILAGVGDTLNLAAAGSLSLADSANITSNVMSGFAMDASESGRAADALAYGASSANVTVEGLGMSMSKAAGAANSAGWSVEQATAALGMFGNVGISAEESGTGLAHMLGQLLDESSKASETFDKFGVQVRNSDGSLKDFADIVLDAKDAGMDFNDVLEAFGADHGKKFATLIGQSDEDIKRMKFSLEDASGAAEKMADTRMDSFQGAMMEAKSAAEGLMITIADTGILDRLRQLVERVADALSGMTGWFEKNADTIKPFVDGFLILSGALAGIIGVFLAVKGAVAGFGAAVALLSNPVGWVIVGIVALGAALVYAWKKSERFREIVTAAWTKVKDGVAEVIRFFSKEVWPILTGGAEAMSGTWESILDGLKDRFGIVWDGISRVVGNALDQVKAAWRFFKSIFRGDWEGAWDAVKEYFALAWDNIKTVAKTVGRLILTNLRTAFKTIPSKIGGWVKENGPKILEAVKTWWSDSFVPGLQEIGRKLPGKIEEWTASFLEWAKGIPETIKEWIGDGSALKEKLKEWGPKIGMGLAIALGVAVLAIPAAILGVIALVVTAVGIVGWELIKAFGEKIAELATELGTWFSDLWSGITGWFADGRDKVVEVFTGMVASVVQQASDLYTGVATAFSDLWESAKSIWDSIRTGIADRVSALRSAVTGAISSLYDRVVEYFSNIWTRVKSIWNTLTSWLTSKTSTLRTTVADVFTNLKERIVGAFDAAQKGIKRVWDKIKRAVKTPVNFVIDPVYANIRKVWNNIAGKVGIGELPSVAKFAQGGRTHGGVANKDSIPALMMADEFVIKKSSAKKLGWDNLRYMNATGELPPNVQQFNNGGIVGAASSFLNKSTNFFKDGFMKAFRGVTNPIKETMQSKFGSSGFKGLPTRAVKYLLGKAETFLTPFESLLAGGDGQAVVKEAAKHVGVRGRPNSVSNLWMKGPHEWCGSFAGQSFHTAGAKGAIKDVSWKPLVRNWTSLPKVSASAARPGDVALYRGDSGHINIVEDPKKKTTIGGNESNSVKRQTGYMNSASSIRRPKFAAGGRVLEDMAKLAYQDSRETNPALASNETLRLRKVFKDPMTYDSGGILPPGLSLTYNGTGKPEPVFTHEQFKDMSGGGTTKIEVCLSVDDDDFLKLLREKVRVEGGGDVQVAFGSGGRRGR